MLFITVKSAEAIQVPKVLQVVEETKRIRYKAGELYFSLYVQNIHHLQVWRMKRGYINMSCMTLWKEGKDLDESIWMMTWKTNMRLQRTSPSIWAKSQYPSCNPKYRRTRNRKKWRRKKTKRVGGESLSRPWPFLYCWPGITIFLAPTTMETDTAITTTNLGKPASATPAVPSHPSPSGSSSILSSALKAPINKLRRSDRSPPPNPQVYTHQVHPNQPSPSPSQLNNPLIYSAPPPTTRLFTKPPPSSNPPAFPVPIQQGRAVTPPVRPISTTAKVQGFFDMSRLTQGRWAALEDLYDICKWP